MTRILLAVTLMMASATLALSQMPGEDTSADEAQIRTLIEESGEAQLKRDIAALDRGPSRASLEGDCRCAQRTWES
jgi:hypothetical protein